jgi:DNA-3-methyladenine glycosylase II
MDDGVDGTIDPAADADGPAAKSGGPAADVDDPVIEVLREDPTMATLVDRHGPLDVAPADDEFARLCTSIVNQQLSTASAAAIHERFVGVLGGDPTPDRVLAADEAALREAGLSGTKVDYLRNVAAAFRDDERDFTREGLAGASDEAVVDRLTEITGVGEWTARMYLVFALGREDVLPLGDLAVRKGIELVYNGGESLSRAEMREIAEAWRPYRSYGTRYIWAEYES